MANQLTSEITNRGGGCTTQPAAQDISRGASRGANARIGDSMIDDMFISDRVIGEIAEYRAPMNAAIKDAVKRLIFSSLARHTGFRFRSERCDDSLENFWLVSGIPTDANKTKPRNPASYFPARMSATIWRMVSRSRPPLRIRSPITNDGVPLRFSASASW